MMLLNQLFKNIKEDLPADLKNIEINNIRFDSRKVAGNDLFVAIKGFQTDGHDYLQQVYEKGAAAAVVEEIDQSLPLTQVKVDDSRTALSLLAYNFYADSLEKMLLVGITGTNGKTTTSYLVRSILQASGLPCGLVGTIHYIIANKPVDAWNTTPESVDLYEMLAEMQKKGDKACVLEVSSHALALSRVLGLEFKAAVFTNLSRDHMDFHPTMEAYFKDKAKLFDQLSEDGPAVINADDVYGKRLSQSINNHVAYGHSEQCDVFLKKQDLAADGTHLQIATTVGDIDIHSRLIGDFNTDNILAAVAVATALKIDRENIKKGIENLNAVPGRLEPYDLKSGALAVIDYAHTPDALEKALTTVRKITQNKLMVVFGCGGDRDRGKRPEMGKAAQQYADILFITDDNPRTEDSRSIIDDILQGVQQNENVNIIYDRREAINAAVRRAGRGDVILIAGKGHEKYQVIGKVKHDFDEVAIIREAEQYA